MAKLVFFYAIIGIIMLLYCSNSVVVEGVLHELKIHIYINHHVFKLYLPLIVLCICVR